MFLSGVVDISAEDDSMRKVGTSPDGEMDDDDDDDDVYYSKGRRPREDEEGEESYEKRRQWPGRGG